MLRPYKERREDGETSSPLQSTGLKTGHYTRKYGTD
jgi:hypothetical protein